MNTDVTQLLNAIDSGDPRAAEQLLPLVYDELRRLAAHKMANERPGHTLQATALVHEAWIKLAASWSIWEIETGRPIAKGDDMVYGCASFFSPDQSRFLYAVEGWGLRVMNLESSETETVIQGHEWDVHQAVFSHNGELLATSSNDEEIRIWRADTWEMTLPPLRGHQSGVYYLEFAPDDKTLVSAANDHTIRFWSLANGQELLTFEDTECLLQVKSPYVGLRVVSLDGNRLLWQKPSSGTIESIELDPPSEIDGSLLGIGRNTVVP